MCLTNPLRKVIQIMVNVQTYKHISQERISGTSVRSFYEEFLQISKEKIVLKNMIGCFDLTAICYGDIAPFHIQ